MTVSSGPQCQRLMRPNEDAFRRARTCYDHLAGQLGVALADALQQKGWLVLEDRTRLITASGQRFLCEFGIDLTLRDDRTSRGRPLCRSCLDGTERRPHLSGRLGAALCARCFDLGWIERLNGSRAVAITRAGQEGFAQTFRISL
jgi:hypothetical protein